VGDRELMAAYVSKVNESAFCISAHTATARQAYQDGPRVAAVLTDLESAPIAEPLRATLRMLGRLTREGEVGAAFNTTDRLGDAFGFELLSPEGFEVGGQISAQAGLPVAPHSAQFGAAELSETLVDDGASPPAADAQPPHDRRSRDTLSRPSRIDDSTGRSEATDAGLASGWFPAPRKHSCPGFRGRYR
jgi:AhpD family alkylhydroperoxidase